MKTKKLTMREEFEIVKKLASDLSLHTAELGKKIQDRWGFNYSDVDYERAIDTLDYGVSDLLFEEFVQWMKTEGRRRNKYGIKGHDY